MISIDTWNTFSLSADRSLIEAGAFLEGHQPLELVLFRQVTNSRLGSRGERADVVARMRPPPRVG